MPKHTEAKRDGMVNPQNYNFNYMFETEKFDALKTLRLNRSWP